MLIFFNCAIYKHFNKKPLWFKEKSLYYFSFTLLEGQRSPNVKVLGNKKVLSATTVVFRSSSNHYEFIVPVFQVYEI